MGLSVFIPTGDNHGDPLISPVVVISRANFAGLLRIAHTQKIFVRSHARFRGLLVKWRNRLGVGHVSSVARLARTSGTATVGHPTEALGRVLYNFLSGANKQDPCFACHD